MIRNKAGAVAATAVLSLGALVFAGGTASAMPHPAASGSVTCSVTGVGKFGPKLTAAGTPVTVVKTVFKGISGTCTGTATAPGTTGTLVPVTVTAAKFKGAGYYSGTTYANSCPVFSGTDSVGSMAIHIKWTATPAIANTVITLSGPGSPVVSGSLTDTITLPSGATISASGSFASPPTFALSMLTNIASTCSSVWGPYPHYTFGAGSSLGV